MHRLKRSKRGRRCFQVWIRKYTYAPHEPVPIGAVLVAGQRCRRWSFAPMQWKLSGPLFWRLPVGRRGKIRWGIQGLQKTRQGHH